MKEEISEGEKGWREKKDGRGGIGRREEVMKERRYGEGKGGGDGIEREEGVKVEGGPE